MNIIKSDLKELKRIVELGKVAESISAAQGRTIMSEVVVSTPNKYSNISNVKLMNGFGSDMITLKKYDYINYKMAKYNEFSKVSSLIGLNMELKLDGKEMDTYCPEHFEQIEYSELDYLVLTIYPQKKIRLEQAREFLEQIRKGYKGFIFLNFYVQNPHQFKSEILSNMEWIQSLVDMIAVPIPGTVYGISKSDVIEVVTKSHDNNILVAGTICTSQEGAETNIMSSLGLNAKECGFDVHMFGDASACDIPLEENIFEYSKVIRGKRHTYFRMNV